MKIICNKCREEFELNSCCPKCSLRVEQNGKTWVFDEKHFFYGAPSQETLHKSLTQHSNDVSPLVVLDFYDHKHEPRRQIGKYLGDPRRVAPIGYLDMQTLKDACVLDYGCGLGVFTSVLAERCKQVCAVDATLERSQFTSAMATFLGYENIITAKGAIDSPLFFADKQFDLVILNGVLEWTPETFDTNSPPRHVLIDFLNRIKRLLKSGGVIYVGIENRYAYDYFLGRPDHHSGLLFGSLLPRTLANIWSKYKNNKPYRTYTFSRHGYKKLFGDAGFITLKDVFMFPSYQFPKFIGPVEKFVNIFKGELEKNKISGRRRRLLSNLLKFPFSNMLLKRMYPACGFFISESDCSSLIDNHNNMYYLSQDGYAQGQQQDLRVYRKFSTKLWNATDRPFEIQQKFRNKLLRHNRRDLADLVPDICRDGDLWLEETLPGKPLIEDLSVFRRAGLSEAMERNFRTAMRNMSEMYALVSNDEEVSFSTFARKWIKDWIKPYSFEKTSGVLNEVSSNLEANMDDIPVHISLVHGNFSPRNVLIHKGHITGFIDWKMAESQCASEVDLLDFLFCHLRYVQGYTPGNQDFFARFRQLHVQFSDAISVGLPKHHNHSIYLFVAIRNIIVRGRGCYLNVDELKSIIDAWKEHASSGRGNGKYCDTRSTSSLDIDGNMCKRKARGR